MGDHWGVSDIQENKYTCRIIEYFFTADYNPLAEAGIYPLAEDLDWSLCEPVLREKFQELAKQNVILSGKDKQGLSLEAWAGDPRSENFLYR